jgi:hypothetical protein
MVVAAIARVPYKGQKLDVGLKHLLQPFNSQVHLSPPPTIDSLATGLSSSTVRVAVRRPTQDCCQRRERQGDPMRFHSFNLLVSNVFESPKECPNRRHEVKIFPEVNRQVGEGSQLEMDEPEK